MARPCASVRFTFAAATATLASGVVQADQLILFDIGPSAAMVSSCAGLQNGNGVSPGGLVGMLARSSCASGTSSVAGSPVTRFVAYDENPQAPVSGSAQGSAEFGQLKLASSFKSDTAQGLTIAVTNAGWNAPVLITPADPGLAGKLALWTFDLHLTGNLYGAPFGNSGVGLSMAALRDNGFFGSTYQVVRFGNLQVLYDKQLNETVTLAVPVVLGTPFTLGVYAAAFVGNSSGFGGISEASIDLMNTITWAGTNSVSLNGSPIAYTMSSTTGFDWDAPFAPVPEPSLALMLVAGLGAVGLWRRRLHLS